MTVSVRPLLAAFLLLVPLPAAAAGFGPLPSRSHHPVYGGLLIPAPEEAAPVTEPSVTLSLDHSVLFAEDARETGWTILEDKEETELGLTWRQPVAGGEVGVSAGIRYAWAGFMDDFVNWWHSRLGYEGYTGQTASPPYRYEDRVLYGNHSLIEGTEKDPRLGDTTLWWKQRLPFGGDVVHTVELMVQAPTGVKLRGTGNDRWDYAARLLTGGEYAWDDWRFPFHTGIAFTGPSSFGAEDTPLDPVLSGFVAGEVPLQPGWVNAVVQFTAQTAPLSGTLVKPLSSPPVGVMFGFSFRTEEGGPVYKLGFFEDLNCHVPDFTIHLSVGW